MHEFSTDFFRLIAQITDTQTNEVIAVSNANWKCEVIHEAPLNKSCEQESNPVAGVGACGFTSSAEPDNWKSRSYDDSAWSNAIEYTAAEVSPKDGYDEVNWDSAAQLIWGPDLETSNTILCRLTIEDPDSISTRQSTPCQTVENSILDAGFEDVTVTCDNTYAYINSDTYPDHDKMNGITGTNEQIPVPALNYASPIRLNPTGTSNTITIDASLGVAINGVPIYDYSSQGDLDVFNYDPNIDTFLLGQLDNCGGHAGRGDDYHYHARPGCMIDAMLNYSDAAIIGWAYDGYPIYDTNNPDGTIISEGSLDVCNGQADSTFGYRYHISLEAPYVPQCLRGDVDLSKMPRVAPMRGRSTGTPPQGGVSNLVFTQQGELVRMDYTHQGQNYYLQYTSSATPNCYLFETKTVTDGGIITTGEFCR